MKESYRDITMLTKRYVLNFTKLLQTTVVAVCFVFATNTVGFAQQSEADSTETLQKKYQYNAVSVDKSVDEKAKRLPGIQVNAFGDINPLGLGLNHAYVLINGQRVPTTGFGNRSTWLRQLPTSAFSGINYTTIVSPEMNMDAHAGVISLTAPIIPLKGQRTLDIGIESGLNSEYVPHSGNFGRAWINYAERYNDKFAFSMQVAYNNDQNSFDRMSLGYGTFDFGDGEVDVLEEISPGMLLQTDEAFSGNLRAEFTPNKNTMWYANVFLNQYSQITDLHQNSFLADGNWDHPDTTSLRATFNYGLTTQTDKITTYMAQAGGEHDLGGLVLDYSLGWGKTTSNREKYTFPFQARNTPFYVDGFSSQIPQASFYDEKPEPEDMLLQEMTYVVDKHIETRTEAKLNATLLLDFTTLKAGISAENSIKDANEVGAYRNYRYTYRGFLNINGFNELENGSARVLDNEYNMKYLINPNEAISFFRASIPNMRLDEELFRRDSEINNYLTDEMIYSGYTMAQSKLGIAEISIGARVEHTEAEMDGRRVSFNRFGQYYETNDTTDSHSYTDILPFASLSFTFGSSIDARFSYSETLKRPNYRLSAPYELAIPRDTLFVRGNSQLDPTYSNSVDGSVSFSHTTGRISAGGYYKMISNTVEAHSGTVEVREGEYEQFDPYFDEETTVITGYEQTFVNSDEDITVTGFFTTVEQQLSFLPSALSPLGFSATYAWADSDVSQTNRENRALLGQHKHNLQLSGQYKTSKWSLQINYNWSDEALVEYSDDLTLAPSLGTNPVYLDQYQEGYEELSGLAEVYLSDSFTIWASFYHLLQPDAVQYLNERDLYPTSRYERNGLEFALGLRFTL